MNRKQLVDAIATETGQDKKAADEFLSALTDVVLATVATGDPVNIAGFCKFAKVETKARTGRNPATGETIQIPAKTKPRITPLKGFKDVVMGEAAPPSLKG